MYIPADLVPERQHTSSPFRIEELFEDLRFRTEEHVHCLEAVGMGERAQGIRIERFSRTHPSDVDLAPFQTKSPIPVDVMDFDPSERNTLLTSCRSAQGNRPDDIQRVLDIRLYPVLRELIEKWGLEVFLGSEREFEAYYQSERWEPIIKFHIPSAAKYYLVRDSRDNLKVVLSGLVGRENLIAQLMTVKLAGLLRDDISIIGDPGHLHDLARDQVLLALDTIPALRHGPNALIVAGCGLEENANAVARKVLGDAAAPSQVFHQTIVSLTYTPVWPEKNGIRGIIALDQQYGEIMETIVAECIEKCACRTVFCGGAGGYIPGEEDVHRPPIGSRIAVRRCMHPDGETVYLDHDLNQSSSLESAMHLHVPSIFCETFDWLEDARDQGSSVDIELFHILKAISSHNERHAEDPVAGDLGYFVSDYVGEKPLREYSGVFDNYAQAIRSFLNTILGK